MSFNKKFSLFFFNVLFLIFTTLLLNFDFNNILAYPEDSSKLLNNNSVSVKNYSSYIDSSENIVVVGSVVKHDNKSLPQNVTVGMEVYNKLTDKSEILTEKPFSNILYKNYEPFPFKFIINSTQYSLETATTAGTEGGGVEDERIEIKSSPFIYKSENLTSPYTKINTFDLKYPAVISEGQPKELYGNITNTSPLQLDNLTLFAIVNDKKGEQIDSVKTFIPSIRPYETVDFTFRPDPAIIDRVYFYSCVGGDPENMRVDKYKLFTISNYKVLGYKYSDMMVLDDLTYNKTSNQLNIQMDNIYPIPGALSMQIMPYQINPLSVYLDGTLHDSADIKYIENMIQIDLSVPNGAHEVVLSGIEEY